MEVKDKLTTLESLKVAYDANRESINTLSEELLAQMGDVAQQSDVDALNARVTNLELNAGGDSNAEVVDARVSNSGTTYGTLKERLDEEYNQLTKELENDFSQLSSEKVDRPTTGKVGQILEIETVDENGKPKTYKSVDKPTGGDVSDEQISSAVEEYMEANPVEVDVKPQWASFPRLINPARDIYNSVSMANKKVLGTDGTLRHNLMIHGALMTWTESTGSVDYADSSGAASVKLMGHYDYFGNGHTTENVNMIYTDVFDVFPSGADIYGVDGTVIDTVVASSDSTIIDLGSNNYIIMAGCQGASAYHMVYREVNYKNHAITLGDTINVLTIGGAEWDMTTLREDYFNKYSQLNTKVIKDKNIYYMAMVQSGVGIAVMKSSDGKEWSLHHHIPDTDCHLEACIGLVQWINNKMPTVYVVVRNNYGHGYITLYGGSLNTNSMTLLSKTYIPASSGRAMLDTVNNKDIYLTYSVNGRHNAVIAQILPNNDGTSGISILETPRDTMSNYPTLHANRKSTAGTYNIMFGGTDGLNKNGSSISCAYLWNENNDVLKAKNEQLKKVMFGTSVEVVQTLKEGTEIGSVGGTKLYAPKASSGGGGTPTLQLLGSATVEENTASVNFEFTDALNLKKILVYAHTKGVEDYSGQARGMVYINDKNVADGQDNASFNTGVEKYMLFDIDIHQSGTIGRMYMQNAIGSGYSSEKVSFLPKTEINANTDITKISFKANGFDSVAIASGTTVDVYGY